ncbi:MAG: translocation/assembly module TamB domain-containing protein, partial [Sulfitobacter sp.]
MKRLIALTLTLLLMAVTANAQEDDRGFLTRKIEEALTGLGREVRIDGFTGALSSEASFDRLTIADDQGIWMTLDDVVLIWNRTALLRGRLEVEQLTAQSLDLPRLPMATESDLPKAEATPFALPDLPVSIAIQNFEVARIALGAPILGEAADLNVTASAILDGEGAKIDVVSRRTDAKEGAFEIDATFARDTSILSLLLKLEEAQGGIAARLLDLPGQPTVGLNIDGTGPLDDFSSDIALATDGQPRLTGQVTLSANTPTDPNATPDRRIQANLGGDITAIIVTQYRDFFGPDVGLTLDAQLGADGTVAVDAFTLDAQAAQLSGQLRLNRDKWPTFIDIDGVIANADRSPVLLPGSGMHVDQVDLAVTFDAADGDAFSGIFDIRNLAQDAVKIDQTQLRATGTLRGEVGAVGEVLADIDLRADGVALSDQDAAKALGSAITGTAKVGYVEGEPVIISDLELTGADYGLIGQAAIGALADGLLTQLDMALTAQDLSRFAGLTGQQLSGAADLQLKGSVTPLSGMFDLDIAGTTNALSIGIEQADAVLAGRTTLSLNASRSETGTDVKSLALKNRAVEMTADAALRTEASQVEARMRLNDVGLVAPQYSGPVALIAKATQDARGWTVDATADGPYDAKIAVQGLATGPDADVSFDLSIPQVKPFVPQVSGPLQAKGRASQAPKGWNVDVTAEGPYASKVAVQGLATGPEAAVSFTAKLPNVGVFVPQIAGPLSVSGDARQSSGGWRIDTTADGPSGTKAAVAGQVAADGNLDITIKGSVPLGLSAPFIAPRSLQGLATFDLALRGAPALSSLAGQISTTGASFSAPNLRLALVNMATRINLSGGRAQVQATADVSTGGRAELAGSIVLTPSLPGDLRINLEQVVLTDPQLYSTTLNGQMSMVGPLRGGARIDGRIDVGETNVTVPASGLTSIGDIPAITHIGAPRDVSRTRARAGLLSPPSGAPEKAGGPAYLLNIKVNAPGRIFVRGRGVDAELGGAIGLTGNSNNVISAGRFDLLRGRIDILGKRFDLSEGAVQFQGSLTPFIRFVTSTETTTGTVSVILEGPADQPTVTFSSTPEAPQDEVLSQLLFGRDLTQISA